ncbi:hypothetical protein LTR78_006647 [Recurvomyces mirabilis]|uniref:Uncharacterized protein n=1 Tax=Recurvomyces mirabilis TaxID=574656 RepID=A0AAE0WKK9_9PEZI|nr:hypothetical protein LTR78_006647 [Recurvomyces mirabilis]KAK5151464.1 hypothetical protein LTS14_009307 [Recurvomyces mirabilis]
MSGGGNNITISYPGNGWQMLWPSAFGAFQLDIVGFLAILGEGSVAVNAQVSALSDLFFLPRLMPAPQALLFPTRPVRLEPVTKAYVTAVQAGNVIDHIHHVASILLSKAEDMPEHMVRCVEIRKSDKAGRTSTSWSDRALKGQPSRAGQHSMAPVEIEPSVTAKAFGPLAWVTLNGLTLATTLFLLSMLFGDGMSMLATVVLSLLSTLIGVSNKWSLTLIKRRAGIVPPGDVVIRYPNGSFLVVKCAEDIARELFFAPEKINYMITSPAIHRLISLVGTLMLMFGVIALANARLELQFAWGGAYIIINAVHWIAAAVPQRMHWDFSCYVLAEQGIDGGNEQLGYTEALWKAIMITQSIDWCRAGAPAAPLTKVWDEWLVEAGKQSASVVEKSGSVVAPYWDEQPDSEKGHASTVLWSIPKEWDAKKAWNDILQRHRAAPTAAPANSS